jgi:hypothetical protein
MPSPQPQRRTEPRYSEADRSYPLIFSSYNPAHPGRHQTFAASFETERFRSAAARPLNLNGLGLIDELRRF